MSRKRLHELRKEIASLEVQLSGARKRKGTIKGLLSKHEQEKSALWDSFKAAAMQGKKSLAAIEKEFDGHERETRRLRAEAEALTEKITASEKTLQELQAEHNSLIAGLVCDWLKKEVAAYDEHARAVIDRGRRIMAANRFVTQMGESHRLSEVIGPGLRHIPQCLKVPVLKDFDGSLYLERARGIEPHDRNIEEEVLQEAAG